MDIFFHGHDHFFAKQELDGVIYQLVPQPSHPETKLNTYGYLEGDFSGGSGHLRVTVSEAEAKIEFVKHNQEVAYSYFILRTSPPIIPEFPTWAIPTFLLTASLLTFAFASKKLRRPMEAC